MSSAGKRSAQSSGNKNQGHTQRITKSQRLDQMARKRDERVARQAYRKEKQAQSYLSDDETYASFSTQLAKMGLHLRDIPGDGNCLFRALGDQLQGHGRDHLKHRHDVVKHMQENRTDYEPFVEDDVPFERHVKNLNQSGTYAGNDAIVAFARLHGLNIVIHQVNSPCWQIRGTDKTSCKQLHISYHNGDHYSSVRKLGDNSETPANIRLDDAEAQAAKTAGQPLGKKGKTVKQKASHYTVADTPNMWNQGSDGLGTEINGGDLGLARAIGDENDLVETVMRLTGCEDQELVQQTLEDHFYDVDSSVDFVCQIMAASIGADNTGNPAAPDDISNGGIWSENGTAARIFGSQDNFSTGARHSEGAKPKQISSAKRKRDKKIEKKARAMERKKQEMLGLGAATTSLNTSSDDDESIVIVADKMGTVKI